MNLTAVRTQAEVAALLGTTRSNVSCIEARAMKKLRRSLAHLAPDDAKPIAKPTSGLTPERRAAIDELRWKPSGGQS